MAVRHEPTDFSPKIPQAASGGSVKPLFNAGLGLMDDQEQVHPQLAEALPRLNSDEWRIFPDGRMETTYRLRPNLTWHDGAALTAEDFVFAWRLFSHPGLGSFSPKPQDIIDEVAAPDLRTVLIRWRAIFPEAGELTQEQLPPLPRHVLEAAFADFERDATSRELLLNHPYWTTGHVGAGPFRLERWDPASLIEASAFAGYALGRPRLDRIIVRLMSDENTVLTAMLAGQIQLCYQYCLRFEHGLVLKRDWEPQGAGLVLLSPEAATYAATQFRPEYQKTPALLDVQVRRALAHGIDKQALLDGLFEGQGTVPETHVPTSKPYFPDVDRRIAKYPFDPRRAEQAMNQAGFARDREGFFADGTGQRFQPDFTALAGATSERAQAIIAATWRGMGFDVRPHVLPNAQVRDAQVRHTYSGIGWAVGGSEQVFASEQIGTPSNRWGGSNRGGWSNAEYDRLWEAYNTTLAPAERREQLVRMAQLVSEELPIYILYFNYTVVAHAGQLTGPRSKTLWNVHEWALRPGTA
jgi:peptide/nickel transport system substrate-binding protein